MRVALIGLGMVAGTYASALRDLPQIKLAWVHARQATSRAAFLKAHGDLGAVEATELDQITGDPDLDFVIVTTPPNARDQIVTACAQAGLPVLMEKPVERDLKAATALVETCEAAGVPLGITLQHRARPVVADLRARLGDLGPLCAVEVNVPWWRGQAYYDEPGRGTYARDGGGVLISQAIHTLDLMLSMTGPITEVHAMAATTGFHQMEAEDFVCAGLRFANGAVGQLFATTASYPGRGETITLHGANGSAHLEAGVLRLDWQDGSHELVGQAASSGAGADPMAFTSDWHRDVIADFAKAVRDKRSPLVPGRTALEVHALIDALERSARAGAVVQI